MKKLLEYQKLHTFLKNGAVFIADSHYRHSNETLYTLLTELNKTPPSQLFLVGDIFQLLLDFPYLIEYNKKVIEIINSLAKKTEVYYFEGNHDFCLENVFSKDVILFKELKKDGICINHGDIYLDDKFYKFYVKIIRKKWFMKFINIVSFNFINNWMFKKILSKNIRCDKMDSFEKLAKMKINLYKNCQLIIEGHYHQNKRYKNYLNLPALYCQKSYLKYENGQFIKIKVK
jgi:UDP-2,3-diacylglucosamine hydrolase